MREILSKVAGQRTRSSYIGGDPENSMLPCGQVVGLIEEVKTISEVIDEIIKEASELMNRLKNIVC